MAKEPFADYVKEKNLSEPEKKKELTQTLKTYIFTFGFCDIQNNQGLYLDLDYSGYHKTSSNNCLKLQQCNMNLRSTNVRTIQDTLCIKDHFEYVSIYFRIRAQVAYI